MQIKNTAEHYRYAVEKYLATQFSDQFVDELMNRFYMPAIDTWGYELNPEHLGNEILTLYDMTRKLETSYLLTELDKAKQEIKHYKWEDEQFSWLQEQVKVAAEEHKELQAKLEAVKLENESLRDSLEDWKSDFKSLKHDNERLKEEIRMSNKAIDRLYARIVALKSAWRSNL